MLRATSVVRKAAVKADKVVETLTLDHAQRTSRHIALKGDGGLEILLDIARATVLGDGDAVRLEDGRLVQIKAAAQDLLEIRAENPLRLMRTAWQIGSRHVAAEITADAIYVASDPALAEMIRGQGCAMSPVTRPFQPERAEDHDHSNCDHPSHGHDHHGHDHAHEHHGHGDHGHSHAHAGHEPHSHEPHSHEPHSHEHHSHAEGAACGCGHDHGDHAHGHTHDHGHSHGAQHGHKGHSHD